MLTYGLMFALAVFIAVSVLYGIKLDENKDSFMSVDDSDFLRGFWCLIVVLVHIPAAYQNRMQDMIGSFAYIGVTFFFMTSAYGLKYNTIHKKGYMKHFWKRRLPVILIPALLANSFEVIMHGIKSGFEEISLISFFNINNWVKVLLLYYFIFWIIYQIVPKFMRGGYWQDIVMCLIIAMFSIVERFGPVSVNYGWIVEPVGFAYGIVAVHFSDSIRKWAKEKWRLKCAILLSLSVFCGIAYLKLKPVPVLGDYLLKLVLGITVTAFILETISRLQVGNRLNGFLGKISYEIYLLHRGVFLLLAVIDQDMNSGIFVAASMAITIAFAYVLNRICNPVVKLLR